MESNIKKCSFKDHKEIDAISYCQECNIYMCNDCVNYHKGLFENHNLLSISVDHQDLFNGFCNFKNHFQKLEYFCKTHNQLCCAACIAKIKNKLNGQHTDCTVCVIQEIKKEKRKKLNENIKYLEDIQTNLSILINEVQILYKNLKKNKDNLKQKVQKIFNKIRDGLNEREKQLISEIDKKFNKLFVEEEIIKESENLCEKIKNSIEKEKIIGNQWDEEDKLSLLIYESINIENVIEYSSNINENLKKCYENKNIKLNFSYEELNNILDKIKIFGTIYFNNFKFRQCPIDIEDNRKYLISGEKENIITKIGKNNYAGTICEFELDKTKNHKWKIKILKSQHNQIMVGVATNDFDIHSSNHHTCGWYLNCYNSTLYSGPPHNFNGQRTNVGKVEKEILIEMNMKKRSLKFIVHNQDKGDQITDIPIDKPLFPVVLLYNKNSSVEIIEC